MKYFVALALFIGIHPSHAEELTPAAWCLQNALVNWTPDMALEPVLEGASVGAAGGNQGSLDDVAEFLLQNLDDRRLTNENAKEVLELLARTRSGRYRLAMEEFGKAMRPVVLKDIARKYVRDSKGSTAEQYVPGSKNFAAMRENYLKLSLLPQPTEARARAFDSLQPGDALEKLFAQLGPPQRVETRYFHVSEGISVRRLVLYYRGAGRAVFTLDDEAGWSFHGAVTDPLAFETFMPYRARAAEFGLPDDESIRMAQITSPGLPAIRTSLEAAYRLPRVPLDYLDATAAVLLKLCQNTNDDSVEDTCAWMLRVLRTKGGLRYAALFREIETRSHSLKLRKWASLTLTTVEGVPRAPYDSGNVSLEEWARRYPSPYPGVTYTNGRL